MKTRTFNSLMHFFNEEWAANVLNMSINPEKGPDLIDDEKVVEVKFKIVYPDRYTHISWRTLEHQMAYGKEREAYWALGTYKMIRRPSEIRLRDIREVERFVLERNLYLVVWDWIFQFKPYLEKGKGLKKWENTIRFPKGRLLPRTIESYSVQGGKVSVTEGVDPSRFAINWEKS